jgi:hypothetical protein
MCTPLPLPTNPTSHQMKRIPVGHFYHNHGKLGLTLYVESLQRLSAIKGTFNLTVDSVVAKSFCR